MWSGRIHYLTGGTTRLPRVISYDARRWARSVGVTRDVLAAHGVDATSRIAICHPFAPWAIGMVFAEAALQCGASVYPLGLYAGQPSFRHLLTNIAPTHLCATARNLITWAEGAGPITSANGHDGNGHHALESILQGDANGNGHHPTRRRVAFVAGEMLTEANRVACAEAWSADVVNVYGMAELDTVASELPGVEGLVLTPTLEAGILTDGSIAAPTDGMRGGLMLRDRADGRWYRTGDLVSVTGRTSPDAPWPSSWIIEVLGRQEETVTLSDGTMIGSDHIRHITESRPEVTRVQLVVRRTLRGDEIEIRCVLSDACADPPREIIPLFLESSIDIADSHRHGVIVSVTAIATSEAELVTTPRGKIPTFVEEELHVHHLA